jgi:hypothetical protein
MIRKSEMRRREIATRETFPLAVKFAASGTDQTLQPAGMSSNVYA